MDGYKIVSEVIKTHPNVDMLIVRPYLYVYIKNENIDSAMKNGISKNKNNKIEALFTRLPQKQYSSYLKDHSPVKISASKLSKIKNQKVVLRPVNFKYKKDSLDEDDIQKILEDFGDKIRSMINSNVKISNLPRVDIEFSGEVLPSFVIKIINTDNSD